MLDRWSEGIHHPKPTVLLSTKLPAVLYAAARKRWNVIDAPQEHVTPAWLATLTNVQGWLITARQLVDNQHLNALSDLRAIATVAVGYDNIDVDAAASRGVAVHHTPGVLDATVAELGIALLLASARGIVAADAHVRSGGWATYGPPPLGTSIHGSTVGLLGLGRIGRRIAEISAILGANVIAHTRSGATGDDISARSRTQLFTEADFIVVTVPLNDATRKSIGRPEFELMKSSAVLVNISRGAVVVEEDLIDALDEKLIGGAALDVMSCEPLHHDHPLCRFDNVTLTPHIGSATVATREAMAKLALDALDRGLASDHTVLTLVPELRHRLQ
nr:NAD(P)-dependent oxidoreductase [Rhodococcus sp. 06-621-2]